MAIEGAGKYSKEYLNSINNVLTNRMDGNGGKKDGKVTVNEAYNGLNIGSLFFGLKQGSGEYNKLKALTDKIPQALKIYAGSDGIFQAEEWANFLSGNEWSAVIDQYHSSSNFVKIEMKWVDNSYGMTHDGRVTKEEVKAGLFNNLQRVTFPTALTGDIFAQLVSIIDKYAGEDGTFTVEEYTAMKNDQEYKQIVNQLHLVPFNNRKNEDSDREFAISLPQNSNATQTILQVGNNAEKIKGYYAQNPETGKMIYADENGRRYTKEAFENWERLAKD